MPSGDTCGGGGESLTARSLLRLAADPGLPYLRTAAPEGGEGGEGHELKLLRPSLLVAETAVKLVETVAGVKGKKAAKLASKVVA